MCFLIMSATLTGLLRFSAAKAIRLLRKAGHWGPQWQQPVCLILIAPILLICSQPFPEVLAMLSSPAIFLWGYSLFFVLPCCCSFLIGHLSPPRATFICKQLFLFVFVFVCGGTRAGISYSATLQMSLVLLLLIFISLFSVEV